MGPTHWKNRVRSRAGLQTVWLFSMDKEGHRTTAACGAHDRRPDGRNGEAGEDAGAASVAGTTATCRLQRAAGGPAAAAIGSWPRERGLVPAGPCAVSFQKHLAPMPAAPSDVPRRCCCGLHATLLCTLCSRSHEPMHKKKDRSGQSAPLKGPGMSCTCTRY